MLLAVGVNSSRLLSTKEYADVSTRGKTALTMNPDGTKKRLQQAFQKNTLHNLVMVKLRHLTYLFPDIWGVVQ